MAEEFAAPVDWPITHQSAVPQWECDAMGHFTIAYYYHRLDLALAAWQQLDGASGARSAAGKWQVRFAEEFRSGDPLRVQSSALAGGGEGHVFTNVETGRPTTFARRIGGPAASGLARPWAGPAFDDRPLPGNGRRLHGARSLLGTPGSEAPATLASLVHLFTAASHVVLSAIGIDGAYLKRGDGGFSSFELVLDLVRVPNGSDLVDIHSALVHVGRSSARMVHRLTDVRTGELYATLDQLGVHFDLGARRPAPFPETMRGRIDELLA